MKSDTNTMASTGFRAKSRLEAALIVTIAALALGACKHNDYQGEVAGWTLLDPSQRHPILVSQEPETLDISVARGAHGLKPRQRAKLIEFAQSARASDAGNSKLIVSAPTGGDNEISSMYVVQEIRELLTEIGFSQASIAVEASYDERGPIRVSYLRYHAEGPQCGDWSKNLARDPQNLPYPDIGCANQRNFAAMVANPADLLGPRTETERYSDRRDVLLNKYIKGEVTGASKSSEEKVDTAEN